MKLYWYRVTEDFYQLEGFENVVEMRRENFEIGKDGQVRGRGNLMVASKVKAIEYYREQGLEYIGFERLTLDEGGER